MFADKITITQDYIDLIVKKRKEHNLTAYDLSEKLGKNKSWIPNIENHRIKKLSKTDLFLIFSSFAKEEDLNPEVYILKYLHPNADVELDNGKHVPCYLLQAQLKLNSTGYKEATINTPSNMQQLQSELTNFNNTFIGEFAYLSNDEQYHVLDQLPDVTINILYNISSAVDLFSITMFDEDPEKDSKLLAEVNNLIVDTKHRFKLLNAKLNVYRFYSQNLFGNENNLITGHYDELYIDRLKTFLNNIEDYIFAVYKYVKLAFQYQFPEHSVDFQKIYSMAIKYLSHFTNFAEITFNINLKVPSNNNVTQEEINELQLQLTDTFRQIKLIFENKYAPYM